MQLRQFLARMRDAGVTSGIHVDLGTGKSDYVIARISEYEVDVVGKDGYRGLWTYLLDSKNSFLEAQVSRIAKLHELEGMRLAHRGRYELLVVLERL